jgi:type VI secretion system protein ImpM
VPGEAVAAQHGGAAVLGYYGKVPTNGDFVQRRLPRSFVDPWDAWLQRAMAISREQLAEAWLDGYLTSPIWRFVLSSGLCGEAAAAGVLMPSVDSVGRYYPMTIAALMPGPCNPFAVAAGAAAWFATAEEAALACLEPGFTIDSFEGRLERLGALPERACLPEAGLRPLPPSSPGGLGWSFGTEALAPSCEELYPGMLDELVRARYARYSLWWTTGSDQVAPTLRVYDGLPYEGDFAAFLCGVGT